MYISKDKLKEIITKAPDGTSPEGIVNSLVKQGHTLEGYNQVTGQGVSGVGGFLVGAGKGALSTIRGLSSLGERVVTGIGRAITPEKYEEQLGFAKKEKTSAEELISEEITEAKGGAEKAGKFVEQVAEFAIPASKVSKATKGLTKLQRLGSRVLTSSGVASAQEGKVGKEAGIAGAVEVVLPGASKALKPVTRVVGRLFKGLGAGLSGVSTDTLESIAKNPQTAINVSKQILKEGQESVLERNARTILEGVSKIRQQARSAYSKGLEALSKVDINPGKISDKLVNSLKKNGIELKSLRGRKGYGLVDLSKSEILDTKIRNKAKMIISDINNLIEPDGKKIKSLLNKIESSKFSKSVDPNRQAFNNLMNDLSKGLKEAVNESTDKLSSINKKFSTDMSLVDGIESIFGKVKFKNTTELNRVAKKLETLFNQKGLDPKTINDFLNRIGVDEQVFRTSEAVRGITSKTTGANTKGLTISEIIQQITSSIVTPTAVKNIAIATGLAENSLKTIINNTSPSARALIIKSLIESSK